MSKKILGSVFLLLCIAIATSAFAQDLGIITGKKKGTYYQFGLNLADLVKSRGIKLSVYDSAGSVENVFAVYKTPGIQMGIVQADVLAFVTRIQNNPLLKRIAAKTKMVFPLYNEEVHLLARKEIKDFEDLADKTVAVGEEGSGIYLTSRLLFEISELKPRQVLPLAPDEALAQLKKGKIDAMFYVAGMPVKLFAEDVSAQDGLALVPIGNKSILEFYPPVEIPARTYSWQAQAVNTVAVKAVMISYDFTRLRCENIGQFARTLYENLDWLKANGHPKWKSVDLNFPLKGWEQYECVRKAIRRPSPSPRAPEKPSSANPVADAIKKMLSE